MEKSQPKKLSRLSIRPQVADDVVFDKSVDGTTIWLDGVGGAPANKFLRVDYNPNDELSHSLQRALFILGDFAPSFVIPGHIGRIVHDFENARIFLRLEPWQTGALAANAA